MKKFKILGVVSADLPQNMLPVAKVLLFLYFGLKMTRVLCVDGNEVLGINFLNPVSVKLLPVRCAVIDACLVQILNEFFGNRS